MRFSLFSSQPPSNTQNRQDRLSKWTIPLWVILITLFGLILRFWKIEHGLPYVYDLAEEGSCSIALDMKAVHFNPASYPHFFYYLYFFCDLLYVVYGLVTGLFHKPGDAWLLYQKDPTVFFVIGRSLSAVLGTLTIPVTYLCGKTIFDRKTGLIAAFFLAFSFQHVQWSQIAYRDVTFVFLIMAAFYFCARALSSEKMWDFILGGLLCGLAVSTKYHAAAALVWGPIAAGLITSRIRENFFREFLGRRSLFFAAACIVGFTLGTPMWILAFSEIKERFQVVWGFTWGSSGFLGREGHWSWIYYLTGPLRYGLGLPLLLAAMGGGVLMVGFKRSIRSLFLLSFPLIYFVLIGWAHKQRPNYALPLVPFFCIAGAYFITVLLPELLRKHKKIQLALSLAAIVIIAPSAVSIFQFLSLSAVPDTRIVAWNWIQENISSDEKTLLSDYLFYHGPQFGALDHFGRLSDASDLKPLEEYRSEGVKYIILTEWHLGIILVEGVKHARHAKLVSRYRQFMKELEKSATVEAYFSPYRSDDVSFDRDNIMLASRSLQKMKSFGPALWIYKLT